MSLNAMGRIAPDEQEVITFMCFVAVMHHFLQVGHLPQYMF